MEGQPLSSLAREGMARRGYDGYAGCGPVGPAPVQDRFLECSRGRYCSQFGGAGYGDNYFAWGFLAFIILVIIIWIILWAIKPHWALKVDEHGQCGCDIDAGKVLLWAILIALFILFLVWIFCSCGGYGKGRY